MSSSEEVVRQFSGVIPGMVTGQNAVAKTYVDGELALRDADILGVAASVAAAQNTIDQHEVSSVAHPATAITYNGVIDASTVEEAIDKSSERLEYFIANSGDSVAEIVNARAGQPQLNDRLNIFDEQLAEKAEQSDLTTTDIIAKDAQSKANNPIAQINDNTISSTKLKQATDGDKIKLANLSQEVRDAIAGTTTIGPTPAPGSVTPTEIANGAVTHPKLGTNYNYAGVLSSENLDTITNTGTYITVAGTINRPPDAHTTALVHVFSNDSGAYCTQLYQDIDGNIYSRIKTLNYGGFGEWTSLKNELFDRSVTNTKLALNYNYSGALDETDDLDTITTTGTYITTDATVNRPSGAGTTALLHVWSNDAGTYCTQFYQDINGIIYSRIKSLNYGSFTGWTPINKPLGGKIIVNFGDSIVGNFEAPSSVSAYIASETGATVYNVGFGGCRMSAHYGYWDAFSMYRLADAITTGDFSLQQQALIDGSSTSVPVQDRLPSYFAAHLELLMNIDWSKVYAITIGYGANDHNNDDTGLDDSNPYEVWTFKGALRYSLERILPAYPQIKIMILTPIFRTFSETENSDNYVRRGLKLTDFVQGVIDVAKEYHIPALDNYYDLGFNKFNRDYYFPADDGTHPNALGRQRIGEKVAGALVSRF